MMQKHENTGIYVNKMQDPTSLTCQNYCYQDIYARLVD